MTRQSAASRRRRRARAVTADACVAPRAAGGGPYPFVRDVSILDEEYDRANGRRLGEGANGTVDAVVQRATGAPVALKTMAPDAELDGGDEAAALRRLLDDVSMQRELGEHPHIAPVLDVFVDPASRELHFVMPLCEGGSVPDSLARRAAEGGESARLDEASIARSCGGCSPRSRTATRGTSSTVT